MERLRWEDGWRELVKHSRLPEEVPVAPASRPRWWRRMNARRRAEAARRGYEPLPPRTAALSPKSIERPPTSRYWGVAYLVTTGKWEAWINPNGGGMRVMVGEFDTEDEAARARDEAVRAWGLRAPLNFGGEG